MLQTLSMLIDNIFIFQCNYLFLEIFDESNNTDYRLLIQHRGQ